MRGQNLGDVGDAVELLEQALVELVRQLPLRLFAQQVGLLNKLLVDLRVLDEPMVWFSKPGTGLFAVIVSVVWKVVGFGMIIMLAGIQTINQEVIEAAMIDGASYWRRVWRIIVPLVKPVASAVGTIAVVGMPNGSQGGWPTSSNARASSPLTAWRAKSSTTSSPIPAVDQSPRTI